MKRASASKGSAKPKRPEDLDAYIAAAAPDKRAALRKLRKDIQAAAPDAEEGLSYGLPAFRLKGRPLACFAAATNHCSLYPMSATVIGTLASELAAYATSKGTIRFPPGKPLPTALVRKIIKTRMAELKGS